MKSAPKASAPDSRLREPPRKRLDDVARVAGVGIATVDRVLNERGGVAPQTARRVIAAARQLGLRRILPTPYTRQFRLEVLLAPAETPFFARLSQAFAQVAATLDRSVTVLRNTLDQSKPSLVARRISKTTADGLIVYCEEHPQIISAIESATQAGVPVICLTTDVPDSRRIAYVGIDHTKAGRTAAFFIAKMARRPGSAAVVTSSLWYRAHKQRVAGFAAALPARAPDIRILDPLEGHDDRATVYSMVTQLLRSHRDLVAIYNTGGANREIAAALRNHGGAGEIVFVGHELTDSSTALLRDGVMLLTIDQAPELQARRSVDAMLQHLGLLDADLYPAEIPFTLHTGENA